MILRLLILCLALAALSAPAPAAEPLGRFFFTPGQRASLDVARSQRARATLSTEQTEQEGAPVAQTITYGGLVRRSDGKTTVWINNQAVKEREPASGGAIVSRVRPDGSITLQAPQSGRSVDLKPGQSVELLTGTVEEAYSRRPLSQPEPKPAPKPATDARTGKPPSPEQRAKAEQEREEREQQRLEDAVSRAMQDTAGPKPAATPASPLSQPSR